MGRDVGVIGGAERQISLLSKWLADHGYAVSVLAWDEGQADGHEVDRVRVFGICGQEEGIRGIRFFHPRWTGLARAMRRVDADIYFQMCAECVTGQVAMWCRQNHRRFVFSIASDRDCTASLPELRSIRERVLYRYGLRKADIVIAQTQSQKVALEQGFGRAAVVIPMPCPTPREGAYAGDVSCGDCRGRVLWVGRICHVKRPHVLLELARSCPEWQFSMVGPAEHSEYAHKVIMEARSAGNVTVHGRVTDEYLRSLYATSSLFCSTSEVEGFPNTFLEAWSNALPTVSTFDPDHLIAVNGMGIVAHDLKGLRSGVCALLTDERRWRRASEAAHRYYLENHTMEAVMPKFEAMFRGVVSGRVIDGFTERKGVEPC